ncbi:MAG TPA: proton-conducting transporter membrane subunit [Prolixibacteraceae bacterium]|jgi:formate hydrogenlyase subunit 3/multisubunit Na+/H+ antiporter MnhD subunit
MMGFAEVENIGFLFNIYIGILLAGLVGIVVVSERLKPFFSAAMVLLVSFITSVMAIEGINSNGLEFTLCGGSFIGDIPLRIDALSAWFMLIINLTVTTGVLYGIGYLRAYKPSKTIITLHWVLLLIFQSSMLWVCMVQNSIAFLIAWEIMSLSSLFLVLFDHTDSRVIKAGINYMVQMHLSVMFLTVAFIWVYFKTGTFDFKGISAFFGSNPNAWLFIVFFLGFGLKAGFMGLHTWLPQAHPAAPSHVSGIMSGVIVKMGIYGIFRVITYLKADYILLGDIVLSFSVLTGIFGIMNAAVHRDFKKMLAYCTIENIGLIGIGIGVGLIGLGKGQQVLVFLGFGGALLHVLNHSLFKSLLFYSAGSVYQQTHTRDMNQLGGLIKKMPQTALLFLIGALAIGGIPPFNGFISEFLIYSGLLAGIHSVDIAQTTLMVVSVAGMSIIGGISIFAFTKTFGTIFLGSARTELHHEPTEVSKIMLVPQYLIVMGMLAVAFFSGTFLNVILNILNNAFHINMDVSNVDCVRYSSVLQHISLYSFLFMAGIGCLFFIRRAITRNRESTYRSTWGCGYIAPTSRMQYSGKSFTKPLSKLFNFVLIEKKNYNELKPNEIFPVSRKYSSSYLDFWEHWLINPAIKYLDLVIDLFKFFQNGRIQAYVLYGIVFILIVFIGTVFNLLH